MEGDPEARRHRRTADHARRHRGMWAQRALAVVVLAAAAVAMVSIVGGGRDARPRGAVPRGGTQHRRRAAGLSPAPIQVRGGSARRMAVPILMYHVVSAPPPGTPNPRLWVPQGAFAAQMHALARAGYHAVTLSRAFDAWSGRAGLPRRPVVVSFDDGYLSQYTHALPVLRRLGWPGVLDLELRNLGPRGITEHQVRALLAAGWELASHTIDHPDLTTVPDAQLRHELVDSRRELHRRFGVPVDFFCYPAGRYDARVIAAVRAAGYRGATTADEGIARRGTPYTLPRIRVNGGDSAAELMATLRRGG